MMEEKDPYFSAEEENINNDTNIAERNKIKKNYFDSKFEYMKKKMEEKYESNKIESIKKL